MSQQAGYSPNFKRPAEIMRMRRKRARSEAGVFSSPSGQGSTGSPGPSDASPGCVRPFSPGPLFNTQNRSGGGVKRRNPFANIENTYSPKKKFLIYNDDGNAEAAAQTEKSPEKEGEEDASTKSEGPGVLPFSSRLTEVEKQERQSISNKKCLTFSEDDSLFEEEEEDVKSPLLKSPQAIAPASIAPPVCTEYPADWSLKTRLLFTSPLSLSWSEHPKAQEQALGLSQHCRAQFSPLPHSLQDPKSCSELRCAFQQSLAYWQHPSLPWISLFPRINAERSFTGKSTPWAQDTTLQQSLMSEWSVSVSSLYSLLKARLCPYFYVCSYQFTVLFRAAGLGGSSSISALISPTTRGLREAMKAEGIEFSLPLVEERRKSREQHNLTVHQGEEEEQKEKAQESSELKEGEDCQAGDEGDNGGYNDDDEDGSFSWLKEMGVQDKIKKPDNILIQLRKEGNAVSLDHKPESVVCVEGSHTFTLINFLINCKSLVAAAGSQAGLPPTLLAPVAFRGATMHTLKARSVNVKSQVGSTYQNISSLEITGPILPSSLHTVTTLLRSAQKGNFSGTLYTHAPTAVMNTPTTKEQGPGGSVDLSGFGLQPASIQQLQQPSSLGKTALTHINMNNYSYTWKN
ncbi:protein downstream neighbor of son homolog isoform X2 [Dicentrarchus labrax]|uniref:protein downstream neighbor of son homolog isoform X2 n=1 Tax=Dicentrarchus labrax TaxID=13489 RepID=UPI0021F59FD5|nr:protein downstream neighbor of son homolog isoform X2 [Dicentrarchus labrax]